MQICELHSFYFRALLTIVNDLETLFPNGEGLNKKLDLNWENFQLQILQGPHKCSMESVSPALHYATFYKFDSCFEVYPILPGQIHYYLCHPRQINL